MINGINRIRFPNHPVQERKLNFFVDYYRYFVHLSGLLPDFEIESPLALVDKLIFQLENNFIDKCPPYLRLHFGKLQSYPKDYMKGFEKYSGAIGWFHTWQAGGGKWKYLEDHKMGILQSLKELHQELSEKMLSGLIEEIKRMILCEHPLEKHLDAFIFYVKLLASEIITIRNSRAEARELFDVVMTNEFEKFPYPKHITSDEEKKDYFDKKTIIETLSAISHFYMKEPEQWDINFKIDDVNLPDDYVFEQGNVKIYPSGHPEKRVLIETTKQVDDSFVKKYFEGGDYAIAEVMVSSVTYEGAHREAVKELINALEYVNHILGRSLSFRKGNYLFSTDKVNYGYWFKDGYMPNTITHVDQLKLDDNAFQFFNKYSSNAKQAFLSLEKEYVKARGDLNIGKLWGYLEIMFADGTKDKNVKKFCSGALMIFEEKFRKPQINTYLRNAIHLFSTSAENIGLTSEEQLAAVRLDLDFKNLNKKIKSDFFHMAFKDLHVRKTKTWSKRQRQIYHNWIEELYEQRNMQEHGGRMNRRAVTKLNYTVPMLMARLRWVVFDYIKQYPSLSFKDLVKQIRADIETNVVSLV